MRWWTFNEQQLDRALADWMKAQLADLPARKPVFELELTAIRNFLASDAARTNKMRGDR